MTRLEAVSAALAIAGAGACSAPPGGGAASRPAAVADRHSREIRTEGDRTLLWARDRDDGTVEWFDVTDSAIDPRDFQFGIGKDTIPSIDAPRFVPADDPLLAQRGVTLDTPVLGVSIDGEARAYPVDLMSLHEVVNDDFGGKHYAVLW